MSETCRVPRRRPRRSPPKWSPAGSWKPGSSGSPSSHAPVDTTHLTRNASSVSPNVNARTATASASSHWKGSAQS